jgi:exopolyphosphatase / guanosine-5'-triphosphate,3'-diphosphate pyrophosphatase
MGMFGSWLGIEMTISTIDIGTNTILLLIAEIDNDGKITTLHHEQRIPRIGKDVDREGNIGQAAFERAVKILKEYQTIIQPYNAEKIIVTGTSAIRDSKNNRDFKSYIFTETGLSLDIIGGLEEAIWTYRGGISEFIKDNEECALIDIGGGSTEIILGKGRDIIDKVSLNIGAVRLTERYLKHNPPEKDELDYAVRIINEELSKITLPVSGKSFFGVAGTITTLSAYHQRLETNDPEKVNGYILTLKNIEDIFDEFKTKTNSEILQIKAIPKGREDVLLAGILILKEFMKNFSIDKITTSVRGLRYGIALREWGKL